MYYHASPAGGITRLEPRISNHHIPLVYFSEKRENVLVYLQNSIEKYCRETGFSYDGPWQKWGPYGFNADGRIRLEEYYPGALEETYKRASGWIYRAERITPAELDIKNPGAAASSAPVDVAGAEFVPDAYEAILQAEKDGLLTIRRFEEMTDKERAWLQKVIAEDYEAADGHPDYRHFLEGKFPDIIRTPKDVVAALIWRGDRFMICQRPEYKARPLLWEYMGGKVEPGETKEEALVRECREELGITVSVGDLFTEVTHVYPDLTIRLSLFHASIKEGEPKLLEHRDLRWIRPDEIEDYSFCPADEEINKRIRAFSEKTEGQTKASSQALSGQQSGACVEKTGEEHLSVAGKDYRILRLLGHGKGGYTWLSESEGKLFALKQIHHEPCDYYQFGNKIEAELQDYGRLREAGIRIPEMLACDPEAERIVKEYIEGPTIFQLVRDGSSSEDYLPQVRAMAEKAKAAGLNIDYFPTNFIVRDGLLWYVDYECNAYMEEWSFESWGIRYWSRTPEFEAYIRERKD